MSEPSASHFLEHGARDAATVHCDPNSAVGRRLLDDFPDPTIVKPSFGASRTCAQR